MSTIPTTQSILRTQTLFEKKNQLTLINNKLFCMNVTKPIHSIKVEELKKVNVTAPNIGLLIITVLSDSNETCTEKDIRLQR